MNSRSALRPYTLLQRVGVLLLVAMGALFGALMAGFAGDSGPNPMFYALSLLTLLYLVSGLTLAASSAAFLSSAGGKVAQAIFFGIMLLVPLFAVFSLL